MNTDHHANTARMLAVLAILFSAAAVVLAATS